MPTRNKGKNRSPTSLITVLLVITAIFSIGGLDYINWKKRGSSYFFSGIHLDKKKPLSKENLKDSVIQSILKQGILPEAISSYRDEQKTIHIKIDLYPSEYKALAPELENLFHSSRAKLESKESRDLEGKNYQFWKILGKEKERLSLLFSFPPQPESLPQPSAPDSIKTLARSKVAIIIDDLGYSLKAIDDICRLNIPVAVAILPYSPFAWETAQIAHRHNLEILLHLPLEAVNKDNGSNHTEGLITTIMTEEEILDSLQDCFTKIPHIKGVNNHMGSKVTADSRLMELILGEIKKKHLFFVDSRTSPQSVAFQLAQKIGVPATYRHVFLDTEVNPKSVKSQLETLLELAQKNGHAVGIGHPWPETIQVLQENLELFEKYNCQPVAVSNLLQ